MCARTSFRVQGFGVRRERALQASESLALPEFIWSPAGVEGCARGPGEGPTPQERETLLNL